MVSGAPFFSPPPLSTPPDSLPSPPHSDTLLPSPALAQPLPPSPQPRLFQASLTPRPDSGTLQPRPHLLPQQLPHVPQRRVGLLQFAQHLRAQVCTCTDRGR